EKKTRMNKPLENSTSEMISVWENLKKADRAPLIIGLILMIIISVAFGAIGTQRVHYANEFYDVTFTFEFLEVVRPGTKVRYQGALIVGEVTSIETGTDIHRVCAKLKKDFYIPKAANRITLQTWGYFGGKFINIDILTDVQEGEKYQAGDEIPVQKIVNSTIVMQKIYDYFKNIENDESLIEKELLTMKKRTSALANSPYSKPSYVRYILRNITGKTREIFKYVAQGTENIYNGMKNTGESIEKNLEAMKRSLQGLRERTDSWRTSTGYRSGALTSRVLHEETDYYLLLGYTELMNKKMAEFKDEPYKILFGE
ncbi:MAG: MCE family protein, partial [Leptospiraceae bacterium]|nr:MCE family protein [Leptospiraceae bacterium]